MYIASLTYILCDGMDKTTVGNIGIKSADSFIEVVICWIHKQIYMTVKYKQAWRRYTSKNDS